MVDSAGVREALDDSHVTRLERAQRDERAFVAHTSSYPNEVASDGTLNLNLENPDTNDKAIEIIAIIPSSAFGGWVRIYDGFDTAPSDGSPNGLDNLLMDSDNTPADSFINITENVDYTESSGGVHYTGVLPAGSTGAIDIGGVGAGTEPIVEPGREIVVEIENTNSAAEGALGVVYIELQEVYS